jgi:integration host factor subunit beta
MTAKKLTKAEIVDSVYQKTGMSRKEIRTIIDLFLDDIKDALVKGMSIELRRFGTFEVRLRKGRQKARNPKTGKPVSVNSHGIAAFRPGSELKQDVWNLNEAVLSDPDEGNDRKPISHGPADLRSTDHMSTDLRSDGSEP